MSKHTQRLCVGGAWVAHWMRQAADRFDVLGIHRDAGVDHSVHSSEIAIEIRREYFHGGVGIDCADRTHAGSKMRGAAVGQVVTIH